MTPRFTRRQADLIAHAGAKKRQATIANLIENVRAKTGQTPTEAEIASLLATSVAKVRRHLISLQGARS